MSDPVLIGDAMSGGYGQGPDILHDCTIAVDEGEIAVMVFGMLNVRQGAVRLFGEDITALTPQARVAKGMAFVPQTSNIFTSTSNGQSSRSMISSRSCAKSVRRRQESCLAGNVNRWPWAAR